MYSPKDLTDRTEKIKSLIDHRRGFINSLVKNECVEEIDPSVNKLFLNEEFIKCSMDYVNNLTLLCFLEGVIINTFSKDKDGDEIFKILTGTQLNLFIQEYKQKNECLKMTLNNFIGSLPD